MTILENLNPKAVFHYFEELSRIPHESGNEKQISDYLVNFATQHQLEVVQEPCLNVIIKKPASKGYEQAPGVILQGHMDMVCVKEDDLTFDFATQPIPLVIEGDYIRTKGTTLGADNGIAVAMAMAILADKEAVHPALTVLVTVEEETGMDGVMALDPKNVPGDILINLDSEEEGYALASCAGGVRNQVELPITTEAVTEKTTSLSVVISGLKGGHSGIEINKNRANAIKVLGRLLHTLTTTQNAQIATVSGGEKMNAIPKRAVATIVVKTANVDAVKEAIKSFEAMVQNEFEVADSGLVINAEETSAVSAVLTEASQRAVISILQLMPYGPQTMSSSIEGLVESSSNLGVLEMTDTAVIFNSATRSSVASLKEEINARIETIATLTGATASLIADYPEWQFATESKVRDLMVRVYKELTGQELQVSAIHAGLECGFLSEKLGNIDMISIGPEIHGAHTPKEELSISSTERVFDFLCAVLKEIK